MDDFIKSILAPDPPRLSDPGGDIFFDGSDEEDVVKCVRHFNKFNKELLESGYQTKVPISSVNIF